MTYPCWLIKLSTFPKTFLSHRTFKIRNQHVIARNTIFLATGEMLLPPVEGLKITLYVPL